MKDLLHLFCKPITDEDLKIEMKINEISSKVLSKVKSQLSYPPLNLKRILEETFIMVCMDLFLDCCNIYEQDKFHTQFSLA